MDDARFSPRGSHIAFTGEKRHILLALFCVAAMVAAVWLFWPSSEPVSRGKPLSYWLSCYHEGLTVHGDSSQTAGEAIREMGGKAVPKLLELLQKPNPDLKDRIWAILRKYNLVKTKFPPDQLDNLSAFYALEALGDRASNAVPELISMLEKDDSLFAQQSVPSILGKIGPAAETAIPLLVQKTTSSNAYVRVNSIKALGQIGRRPQSVVPALIASLNAPFVSVRIDAARSLGAFGKDAQSAVPALLELRRKELLNAANEPASVTLPGGGYDVRAGRNGTGPMTLPKEGARALGWPLWPKDVVTAVTNTLTQIDPKAALKAGANN